MIEKIIMPERSLECEKDNRDHDPEHLVHVPVVDHIYSNKDWNGEVENGNEY